MLTLPSTDGQLVIRNYAVTSQDDWTSIQKVSSHKVHVYRNTSHFLQEARVASFVGETLYWNINGLVKGYNMKENFFKVYSYWLTPNLADMLHMPDTLKNDNIIGIIITEIPYQNGNGPRLI